jgi:hypothetical protein
LGRWPSSQISPSASSASARIRGAWLGRTVGNTLGKSIEGLSRHEVEIY